jgi:endo-1,4-beta-mannosidase
MNLQTAYYLSFNSKGAREAWLNNSLVWQAYTPYLSGFGVNYYRIVDERALAEPENTSYENGFRVLSALNIPFARINLNFRPVDANIFFNDKAKYFQRIDNVVNIAAQYNIGLVPVFFWHYYTFSDISGEFIDQIGNENSITRQKMREFVTEVVNRYKNSRNIWAWEFGNEWNLSADLPNAASLLPPTNTSHGNPSTRDPERDIVYTDDMLSAMVDIGTLIKSLDPVRPISTGNSMSRGSQWHQDQWRRGFIPIGSAWDTDSPEEAEIMAIRHCPEPYDLYSVHVYPYNYQRLVDFAEYAANMGKPVFAGEFGTSQAQEGTFEAVLSAVKTYSSAAAIWTFDRTTDTFNINANGTRTWMLTAIAPQAFPTAPETIWTFPTPPSGRTITGFGVNTDPAGISIIDWGNNSTSVVSTSASVNKTY